MRKCLEGDDTLASRLLLSNLNLVNHLLDIGAYEWQLMLEFGIGIEACSIRCSKILECARSRDGSSFLLSATTDAHFSYI